MPATFEEVHGPSALEYFEGNGLTMPALTKLLKRELKAKVTKSIKVKGAVNPGEHFLSFLTKGIQLYLDCPWAVDHDGTIAGLIKFYKKNGK